MRIDNESAEKYISGTVEHIKFRNRDNGFTVLLLNDGDTLTTVVGVLPDIAEGETLRLWGEWDFHPDFGEQFRAEQCEQALPADSGAILQYLSSGVIKGIGAVTATRIVERFGENTLTVIDETPERLAEIKGISAKKAMEIAREYKKQINLREIMLRLGRYGFTPSECMRIYRRFGTNAVQRVTENPYIICSEGLEIGFMRADALARSMDGEVDGIFRVKAGIIYILRHNLNNGHTCIPHDMMYKPAANLLGTDEKATDAAIDELIFDGEVEETEMDGRPFLFLQSALRAESGIAHKLSLMAKFADRSGRSFTGDLAEIEAEEGIRYDEVQRRAILSAMSNGVFILTGGPGTGKTTTLNAIIKLMERCGMSVLLAAPTGRAAKRMSEVTGHDASTIHRLLEVEWSENGKQTFSRNAHNPLKAEAVILDELSMVDIFIFNSLLEAIPAGCRLLLVGDSDQLPPVGAGNVLNDLISSEKVPVIQLQKIFRQAEDSLIVTNAHSIVNGVMPELSNKKSDFFFLPSRDEPETVRTVADLCADRLTAAYGYTFESDIQVLCCSRKGETGTVNMNRVLQQRLNPPDVKKAEIKQHAFILREGDKVMQIKNNYDIIWEDDDGKEGMGVYNGDVGILERIDLKANTLTVRFDDKTVTYPRESAAELELAYAVTVHKSQGNEFNAVIMPSFAISKFLSFRNLLYTAVTRAKKLMIIVGRRECIRYMVDNDKKAKRYSSLEYLLVNGLGQDVDGL